MATKSLFTSICKDTKKLNEFAFTLGEENPYEVKKWIDTKCYALNSILSDGDILKGIPTGKKIMISGGEATAKSYLAIYMIKAFMDAEPNGHIIFFETEGSSTVQTAKKLGIPEDKMLIVPVTTVEDCRSQMLNIVDTIIDNKFGYETKTSETSGEKKRTKIKDFKPIPEEEEEKFIFVIDSVGMLTTIKEATDISNGKQTKDMTRSQLMKGFARTLSLKLSMAQIPMISINHVYSTYDMYNPQAISGGSAWKYMSDISITITKGKQKEGTDQIGIVLNLKVEKSRFMTENKSVKVILNFKKGLNPYSSIYDNIIEWGILPREKNSLILPSGEKVGMKQIKDNISDYMQIPEFVEVVRKAFINKFSFDGEEVDSNVELDSESPDEVEI